MLTKISRLNHSLYLQKPILHSMPPRIYYHTAPDHNKSSINEADVKKIKSVQNIGFLLLTEPILLNKILFGSKYLAFLNTIGWVGIPIALFNINWLSTIFNKARNSEPPERTGLPPNRSANDLGFDLTIFLNFHSLLMSTGLTLSPLFSAISENPVLIPSSIIITATCWSAARFCTNIGKGKTSGYMVAISGGISSYIALKLLSYTMFVALGPNPFVSVLDNKSVLMMICATSMYFGNITRRTRRLLKVQSSNSITSTEIALNMVISAWDKIKNTVLTGMGRR